MSMRYETEATKKIESRESVNRMSVDSVDVCGAKITVETFRPTSHCPTYRYSVKSSSLLILNVNQSLKLRSIFQSEERQQCSALLRSLPSWHLQLNPLR